MKQNSIVNIANESNDSNSLGSAEGVMALSDNTEFRACGFGCEVNSDGDVRHLGHTNILKPQNRKNIGPQRYCIWFEGKRHYPSRWMLVAKAWLSDYKDGMFCIWKNKDVKDCRASNLLPCNNSEFRRFNTNLAFERKAKSEGISYGEFRPTKEKGIECTKDGVFKIDGKISNRHIRKINGKNKVRSIEIKRNGINCYYNVKELIYSAWNGKILSDNLILPADGDWTNIHADNLIQVKAPEFRRAAYHWQNTPTNDANLLPTPSETIVRLKEFQMECQLNIEYLENGDWSGYHKYITDYLYEYLMCFSIKTLDKSRSWATHNVAVVISDLYDLISTNRMVFSPKMFCCSRLRRFSKYNTMTFPHKARPVEVQRAIDGIDVNKLAEKFNTNKLKKFHHKYGL